MKTYYSQLARRVCGTTSLATLVVFLLHSSQSTQVLAQEFSGEGTGYSLSTAAPGEASSGNCNLMAWPDFAVDNYVAMNNEQFENTRACGRCAEVWCTDARCTSKEKAVVYVMDRCPECKHGDLDLSPTVFKKITGSDPSRLNIAWRFVDCPVSGNLKICTKVGSDSHWTAVQPANMVTGVQSMKINDREPEMVDSAYYYKVETSEGMDLSNVKLSVTSVSGESVETSVSLVVKSCVETNVQFHGSTPPGNLRS